MHTDETFKYAWTEFRHQLLADPPKANRRNWSFSEHITESQPEQPEQREEERQPVAHNVVFVS